MNTRQQLKHFFERLPLRAFLNLYEWTENNWPIAAGPGMRMNWFNTEGDP